jgi:hypothetical protein
VKNRDLERPSRRATSARSRRFTRQQEALTIGWLRSLSRSSSASTTTIGEPIDRAPTDTTDVGRDEDG